MLPIGHQRNLQLTQQTLHGRMVLQAHPEYQNRTGIIISGFPMLCDVWEHWANRHRPEWSAACPRDRGALSHRKNSAVSEWIAEKKRWCSFIVCSLNAKKESTSNPNDILTRWQAGIRKQGGVHALRHGFATHALESGADLFTIKQLLGHSSVTSTVRYLRMTDKTLQLIQSPVDKLKL